MNCISPMLINPTLLKERHMPALPPSRPLARPQRPAVALAGVWFPTKPQVQEAATATALVLVNQARFALMRHDGRNEAALWALLSDQSLEGVGSYASPDSTPATLGLNFEHVADMEFARTLMVLYDYGVLGLEDTSADPLDNSEGDAAWVSRILYDLANSAFLSEWSEYAGAETLDAVKCCLGVAELANARVLLEGGKEGFFLDDRHEGLLTFRQLSLLSGMSEPSLRTLASRGAKTGAVAAGEALRTVKHGTASYIEVVEARTWLKARQRYTAVRRVSDRGSAPLAQLRLASREDLQQAVDERIRYLCAEIGADTVQQRMNATGLDLQQRVFDEQNFWEIRREDFLRRDAMRALGEALDWPADVFALRAAQACLSEQLRAVELELKTAEAAG